MNIEGRLTVSMNGECFTFDISSKVKETYESISITSSDFDEDKSKLVFDLKEKNVYFNLDLNKIRVLSPKPKLCNVCIYTDIKLRQKLIATIL